ncbi:MAG: restriction endonuclease subunit S [Bacteroidales bacterium]|nr:restriction endonuclease subunit S [Bacteroidales bacterium]
MKRYESYKPSGISWIGEIPSHWETIKLKNLFLSFSNGTTAEQIKTGETEFPVTRIETISSGKINKNKVGYVQHFPMIEKFLLKSYDILLSHINSYEKIGNFAIVTENDLPIYHGMNLLRLIPREESISNYAQFYFKSLFFIRTMQCFCKPAINQVSVSSSKIKDILIPIPPLDEQKKIVEYLSTKTSLIDAQQSAREKEIRLLEELKQAEIANVVTRGLNPDVPMKDSGIPWIGKIPAHWEISTLRKFLTLFSEKGHGDKQLLSVTRELGVIVRNTEDKEENHNYIPDDLNGYKLVKQGQFVVNKMKSWQGSYGVSNYEGIVSPAYYVCDLEFPYKPYFSLAIRSKAYIPFFSQMSKGIRVDQWDLSTYALKSIPFIVPPIEEQRAIVEYIERKNKAIDDMIANLRAEIDFLTEYKQRLIADAVTGQIKID